MATAHAGRPTEVDDLMGCLFEVADEIHQGLHNVRPALSTDQCEQVCGVLLGDEGLVVQVLYSRVKMRLIHSDRLLEDSLEQLANRLSADATASASWTSFIVRALSVVYTQSGIESARFITRLWEAVAVRAEEKSDGLGRIVLRAGMDSLSLAHAGEDPSAQLQFETDSASHVLLNHVISSLVVSEDRLVMKAGENEQTGATATSAARIVLGIDAAANILETLKVAESKNAGRGEDIPNRVMTTWRRELHVEVMRLLRHCRFEGVQNFLVQTLVHSLYHGWGDLGVLEDVWSFIASADAETIGLHAGLICILAGDLLRFLVLPARHTSDLWDLIFLAISHPSGLCRRRGLHVLHQVLAWVDQRASASGASPGRQDALTVEVSHLSSTANATTEGEIPTDDVLSGENLNQWKDYARVLQVLEVETEIHLLDQTIPTVTRLCSRACAPSPTAGNPPQPTEFRWLGILLAAMLQGGTIARRRNIIDRLVRGHLGLGKYGKGEANSGPLGGDGQPLSFIPETWMSKVFLPALDHVGWDSSACRRSLNGFSRSVSDFLRHYLESLSSARVGVFLALLLEAIKERKIGSTGALSAVLSAFDLGSKRVPAMGDDLLLRVKDTLLTVLPPLNQAKRIAFLDGIVHILGAFTDYDRLAIDKSFSKSPESTSGKGVEPVDRVDLVMAVLASFPEDLVTSRYLSQLASWLAGLSHRSQTATFDTIGDHVSWLGFYRRRIDKFIHSGSDVSEKLVTSAEVNGGDGADKIDGEGRHLCLLGLVLSENFAFRSDREQILAEGLSPLVEILHKCWHAPYLAPKAVQAALVVFGCWALAGDITRDTFSWRWGPLRPCVDEVVTLLAAQLGSLIEIASTVHSPRECSEGMVGGGDARVLLNALSAAITCISDPPESFKGSNAYSTTQGRCHPAVKKLRERCVDLLRRCRQAPLPPIAHLLITASLEITLRAQPTPQIDTVSSAEKANRLGSIPSYRPSTLAASSAKELVLSLFHNKLEGRISCRSGAYGVDAAWERLVKEHDLRKWSCLKMLLPEVLGAAQGMGTTRKADAQQACGSITDGLRTCLREEMPLAMACFRTVFPQRLLSMPQGDRASEFARVFALVWGVFKEARRPQMPLTRDLIAGVLHPAYLTVNELSGGLSSCEQGQDPPMVDAFNTICDFGVANKPNILRLLISRLTALWRQAPGNAIHFVRGIVELTLFKEWARGIEKISNDEPRSSTEAPRLMLLLFIEEWLIPSSAEGNQDSRRVLRALTLHLMELQNSKEFRQCSINDAVTYGRKLRAWQALCILSGYLCHPSSSADKQHICEVVHPVGSWFWTVHRRTSLPPVRQHMEVFAVRMCMSYPDVFLPSVVKELEDFRLPGQVLCSLLIIAGHTLLGKERILDRNQRLSLFEACLPWMVGTHVMGRMIAQLVCHTVLPEAVADGGADHLKRLFSFLRHNPDMVKMRQRQLDAFSQTDVAAMCTVLGMLKAHCIGSNGEIKPKHMCEILQEVMDSIWNEAMHDKRQILQEGREWHQTMAEVRNGTWFEQELKELGNDDAHIQQKILPWNKLDLAVESGSAQSLEQSTAAGRRRQSVVMCASLVDKVPNLAGLARSCEIFAASNLVIPDCRSMKHPSFSKISTGAEQWLPIDEVREERLVEWLRRTKRQGYILIGIEQTNNSICLTEIKFPKKVVLVLGREHSGLPLSIINEMDSCCQIPQQGVLRSLNAHVSGALVLWEYTRQMLSAAF